LSAAPPLHLKEARFYELDILRGVAAILVVMFHYKHFMLISDAKGFDYDHMPLGIVLMPVFSYGKYFVELFFAISGYVFFWLYADAVRERKTSPAGFFIARFSRLYPLYFITLIAAAVLQAVYHRLYGGSFIYTDNTPVNFLLNLIMVQQWMPKAVLSFNGPAWSLSVEVFLYGLFFVLCYARRNTIPILSALVLVFIACRVSRMDMAGDFSRGMPSFFQGALVFYLVQALRKPEHEALGRRIATGLMTGLPIVWGVSYVRGWRELPTVVDYSLAGYVFGVPAFLYVVVPLTLLLFGLMRDRWKASVFSRASLHRWSWIGDISYSIYLLHFPLQLLIMLVLAHWPYAARAAFFGSPLVFAAFFALAIGLAWLSHRYFEMPMQRFLRGWMTRRLAKPATAG